MTFRRSILVGMLLLGCSAAVAQTAPPAGPAGGYLSEFLKACKTGDPALLQKFAEQHFAASFLQRLSAADFAERAGAGCGLSGGWELTEVSSSSKNGLEGTLHASISEAWRNVRLQLDDSSPAKITALGMRPRPAP